MMRNNPFRVKTIPTLVCGLLLAAPLGAYATDDKSTTADDQCVAQCDSASDKCMSDAGKDKDKRNSCDRDYETCLQKCKN